GTQRQLRERRVRLEESGSEIGFLREQSDAADADITAAADRLMSFERDLAGLRTERELLELRIASVHDGAATWRERLAALERSVTDEAPALPPLPQPPIQARVTVETLRRDRGRHDHRLAELRAERAALAAQEPPALPQTLADAESERMLRECFGADPADALAELDDDDTAETIEKRQELVQRRLALLGRVNLLAAGELSATQERHDFMQRELDDVKAARRDLLDLVAQVDREITETFAAAYRDVA